MIFDENFSQPSINLYNFYALSKPGVSSFSIKYYNKILWKMSRQVVEIVHLFSSSIPEYRHDGKDVK